MNGDIGSSEMARGWPTTDEAVSYVNGTAGKEVIEVWAIGVRGVPFAIFALASQAERYRYDAVRALPAVAWQVWQIKLRVPAEWIVEPR